MMGEREEGETGDGIWKFGKGGVGSHLYSCRHNTTPACQHLTCLHKLRYYSVTVPAVALPNVNKIV
ncbi:hypothetical protein E2C01_024776 [Portunus trituberculatus]|uniref:Uncharacterized protein n=1 Tax=Portunus trituberculatus TaxID=210409 RepID=A0A5B7EE51_PORTR|nr:hypothetical protein [Portunus trituberculatus]